MKRIAAHCMNLYGETFINHVVETDDEGRIMRHYPLVSEIAMCEWRNRYDQQSKD
ncbi:MAG: hypothetical protein MJY59_02640 [Bacteroidaceae bacterium]|nr:hypothetical protein [Bacteroidaceae bacterium]